MTVIISHFFKELRCNFLIKTDFKLTTLFSYCQEVFYFFFVFYLFDFQLHPSSFLRTSFLVVSRFHYRFESRLLTYSFILEMSSIAPNLFQNNFLTYPLYPIRNTLLSPLNRAYNLHSFTGNFFLFFLLLIRFAVVLFFCPLF